MFAVEYQKMCEVCVAAAARCCRTLMEEKQPSLKAKLLIYTPASTCGRERLVLTDIWCWTLMKEAEMSVMHRELRYVWRLGSTAEVIPGTSSGQETLGEDPEHVRGSTSHLRPGGIRFPRRSWRILLRKSPNLMWTTQQNSLFTWNNHVLVVEQSKRSLWPLSQNTMWQNLMTLVFEKRYVWLARLWRPPPEIYVDLLPPWLFRGVHFTTFYKYRSDKPSFLSYVEILSFPNFSLCSSLLFQHSNVN